MEPSRMMVDQYFIGGIIAFLLGFALLHNSKRKRDNCRASMEITVNESVSGSESRRPEVEESTDVIIVGAGVAGAALAYTLAKVILSLYNTISIYIYKFILNIRLRLVGM